MHLRSAELQSASLVQVLPTPDAVPLPVDAVDVGPLLLTAEWDAVVLELEPVGTDVGPTVDVVSSLEPQPDAHAVPAAKTPKRSPTLIVFLIKPRSKRADRRPTASKSVENFDPPDSGERTQ